jgi:hypothetical protein
VPDNTKTAVVKANRYEAELNKSYQEMAEHYGIAIIPTRPYCATDKAPVETAVQIIERRIIARLRHSQFLSLDELAEAFRAELEALNDQPFQKLPGSRRSVFLATEQHELQKLPSRRYEYAQFKQAKAGFDYHVALDKTSFYRGTDCSSVSHRKSTYGTRLTKAEQRCMTLEFQYPFSLRFLDIRSFVLTAFSV